MTFYLVQFFFKGFGSSQQSFEYIFTSTFDSLINDIVSINLYEDYKTVDIGEVARIDITQAKDRKGDLLFIYFLDQLKKLSKTIYKDACIKLRQALLKPYNDNTSPFFDMETLEEEVAFFKDLTNLFTTNTTT